MKGVINLSWIQRLYDTYENNKSQIGLKDGEVNPLLPIFHMTVNPHVEIVLNSKGEFIRASLIGKGEGSIIIPCSEDSAGRAGQYPSPHPLSDKLQYVAGDYVKYGGKKWHGYNEYKLRLESWANSINTHPKVNAIYEYIKKESVVNDLINASILTIDQNNLLLDKWDNSKNSFVPKVSQDEVVIRWKVEEIGKLESRTWEDQSLFRSWEKYYLNTLDNIGFCQVTGENVPLAKNHPKSIYSMCANAKLISSNDSVGFTYRGRFTSSTECYGVGFEVSQKAHNALKWLVLRQGYNIGKKSIVCWSTSGKRVLEIFEDNYGLSGLIDESQEDYGYTAEEVANEFKKKVTGYSNKFNADDQVNIIELESVTDGRLSITYYKEMAHDEYVKSLELWHEHCQWDHNYLYSVDENSNRMNTRFVGPPSPMNIAETVYGDGKNIDDELKFKAVDRIIACIVEGRKIPYDFISMAYKRTINREGFDKDWKFDKALSITCALFKKYYFDYKGEVYKMSLEENRTTRDYLYGRLLAVAQNIEQWALSKSGENRMTTADRLMNRFSQHPYSTWSNIELSLKPYLARLQGGGANSREKLIDEIMSLFESEDFIDDHKLSGEFLLGYHCQREMLRIKKNVPAEELNSIL